MKTALTKEEKKLYKSCKVDARKALDRVVKDWRVIAERLKTIHDGELWREEFDSFEDFLRDEEYPFGLKRAYQLMAAVSTTVENERQHRELLGLAEPEKEAVLAIAAADGEVTSTGIRTARELLEEQTAGLEGEEKDATIAQIVNDAEQKAAESAPPASRGGGGGRRKEKDRKASVGKLLDRALHFGRLAKKDWAGLEDVADENDRDWDQVVTLLEGIQTRSRHSTELSAAA